MQEAHISKIGQLGNIRVSKSLSLYACHHNLLLNTNHTEEQRIQKEIQKGIQKGIHNPYWIVA